MSDPIVTFDEAAVRGELRELVRQTVKDTLNCLLRACPMMIPRVADTHSTRCR